MGGIGIVEAMRPGNVNIMVIFSIYTKTFIADTFRSTSIQGDP